MEKMPKNAKICVCKDCDFTCCKQSNYDKHLLTAKHKNRTFLNDLEQKMPENADRLFECECGKRYTARNSLWYHKKKCKIEEFVENIDDPENIVSDESTNKDQLILMLIKQNSELIKETSEFKNMMMEVIKNGTHNTTTNSHNKAFNLNFFLNETCKDAMNITEFVESIKLQLSDLEKVGELGYVEGISNIIVKNLKNLDITQRPVHCTDQKRETMYIKDQDKWEKDEEQKKMHKMVRKVADKNARMLPKFKEAHPDCIKSTSVYSDQYNKLIIEAMGGRGDNDFEKEEKIIKRVSKEVIVEKDVL
ncbi:MAG: hypothetical protein MUP82_05370 [Candidatus Marinimicrobia bacterium]|nr:hypothetical protein [Candidatus Neomarinimicrobiota bacterium]